MTVDGMEPFIKATYALEGDGVQSLVAYERISILHRHILSSQTTLIRAKTTKGSWGTRFHKIYSLKHHRKRARTREYLLNETSGAIENNFRLNYFLEEHAWPQTPWCEKIYCTP